MPDTTKQIAALQARVSELEARLDRLAEKASRDVTALMRCDDILNTHRKINDAELADAFERIKKLELTVFPHLPGDIADLNRVIGDGDDKVYNPLDFRDQTKKLR